MRAGPGHPRPPSFPLLFPIEHSQPPTFLTTDNLATCATVPRAAHSSNPIRASSTTPESVYLLHLMCMYT